MPILLQNLIVLALILVCIMVIARGAWLTFARKRGGIGSCCSKGCDAIATPQAAGRTVFIPADTLRRKKSDASLASEK
jgi:hypothetical protein